MAEEKKKTIDRYVVTEVPVEFGIAIQDNTNGALLDEKKILVQILNDLEQIKKAVGQ